MLETATQPDRPIVEGFRLFSGPSPYRPDTPWRPLAALAATLAALVLSLLPVAVVVVGVAWWMKTAPGDTWLALIATPIQQLLLVALTWYAASRFGGDPVRLLALGEPAQKWNSYVVSFVVFIAGIVVMNNVIHFVDPVSNKQDLKAFEDMFKSDGWWVALIMVGIGAPLSEELLFRGFLFPALARTRAGTIGATLMTSSVWSVIHFYSLLGMIQVFMIGLMFSWILVRTGSVRVTIVCHALYNTGLALAMLAGLGGWL